MSQVYFPMNKNFNPPVSWYMMIDDWFFFETLLVILSTHVVVVQSFLSPLKACIKTSISNAAFGGMLTNVKNKCWMAFEESFNFRSLFSNQGLS